MLTLGINAAFHDCAAVLVADGRVIAAAEEERFTHVKHGKRPLPFTAWQLPFHAIDFCLAQGGVTLADIDHVAYSFDPWEFDGFDRLLQAAPGDKAGDRRALPDSIALPLEPWRHPAPAGGSPWDPLFLAYIVNAPGQLRDGAPHHLKARFRLPPGEPRWQWHWVEHHLAHEASAFLAAPFDDCAVLTLDGRGEHVTTSAGHFSDGHFRRLAEVSHPHSLGMLYERITDFLGFLHSSDEYKVMALASYGTPRFRDQFDGMVSLDDHGGYTMKLPDRAGLEALFGPARERGGALDQRHFDIAASLQKTLEDAVLALAGWLHRQTGARNLALAGGVALNCVMNARLRDDGPFEHVWVQPAAGDAGTALGAALWADHCARGRPATHWRMEHALLGPEWSDDDIEAFLRWSHLSFRRCTDLAADTADLLVAGKVIGWFQGRMEFGPRALGARSILASPIPADMQQRLNDIKDREDFRPVAPVVLEDRCAEWFTAEQGGDDPAPFMLFVFKVRPELAARIPAVVHADGTARVQTVRADQNPRYHALLRAFEQRTGVPILVNTSFNTRGEPMVCSPRDALESFWTSPLDALVIGNFIVEKHGGGAS